MSLDFSLVNDEIVGLKLEPGGMQSHHRVNVLRFQEFIQHYTRKAETPNQVYANLAQQQERIALEVEGYTKEEADRPTELIASLALQREAVRNAMELIERNYLIK